MEARSFVLRSRREKKIIVEGDLLVSPRVDNLSWSYASLEAFLQAES
jgi:aspartyl aminopeptidase